MEGLGLHGDRCSRLEMEIKRTFSPLTSAVAEPMADRPALSPKGERKTAGAGSGGQSAKVILRRNLSLMERESPEDGF